MRFSPDHLTFKALVALDEAVESKAPVPKTFALRFALAYLYAVSSGERWMFDAFWREATEPRATDYHNMLCRHQALTAALNGICRAAGTERTADLIQRLRLARARADEGGGS